MTERIGNCRIVGEIGSGGMAVVYKAVQEPLGRIVAIKALKPSIAVDSQFAKRFEREAHFMASLQHENILHVIDFVKDGRSMYIIMEYVEGIDLYDLLEMSPTLPPEVAAIIDLQVARALDYAHFRGIIHRDIKPANIMISKQGEVKLMDFGIARDETLSGSDRNRHRPRHAELHEPRADPRRQARLPLRPLQRGHRALPDGHGPEAFRGGRGAHGDAEDPFGSLRVPTKDQPQRAPPAGANLGPLHGEDAGQPVSNDAGAHRRPDGVHRAARAHELLRTPGHVSARRWGSHGLRSRRTPRGGRSESAPRHQRPATFASRWHHADAALLGIVGGGGAIQAAAGTLSADSESFTRRNSRSVVPERAGYLRVVVDPWAEVVIDGQNVATTPTAQRIALTPGRHFVKFENPYYQELQQEVRIVTGETAILEVELQPLHPINLGPDRGPTADEEAP